MLRKFALSCLTALWLIHSAFVSAQQPQSQLVYGAPQTFQDTQALPGQALFPPDQIEQLVVPIALYPDALLAQILMAATYPLDIVLAARWYQANGGLDGDSLQRAVEVQPWDPSVKTLVFFPSVLVFMNDNLNWAQDLGNAMLVQQNEVMGAVQRLRKQAWDAGTLQTTTQQRVETVGNTILIQPADPKVVYVPIYDPHMVYGRLPPPAVVYYPNVYAAPRARTTYVSPGSSNAWVGFGAGVLVGGLLSAAILWDRNYYGVYYPRPPAPPGTPGYWVDSSYWKGGWKRPVTIQSNVNVHPEVKMWAHNPRRRGNIPYPDASTRQKYGRASNYQRPGRPPHQRLGAGGSQGPSGGQRPPPKPASKGSGFPTPGQGRRPAKAAKGKPPEKTVTKRKSYKKAAPTKKPAKRPTTKKQTARQPMVKKPKSKVQTARQPMGKKPKSKKQAARQPTKQQQVTRQPTAKKPTKKKPTKRKPTAEQSKKKKH